MSKIKSVLKKANTIAHVGLEPYQVGMHNFRNPVLCVELRAEQRAKVCAGCPMFVIEPIEELRVVDERIPILSNKMCDECGCELSYKTRQSIEVCKHWKA